MTDQVVADQEPVRVTLLLDRSQSMSIIKDKTISALNEWLLSMRNDTAKLGEMLVTVFQFDTGGVDVIAESQRPEDVSDWTADTFQPRGSTNLYDSIGHAIERSKRCLFAIMTDGEENASRRLSKEDVQKMIAAREAEGWTFVYLGANQDAFAESGKLGMTASNTMNFSAQNVQKAGAALGMATSSYRSTGGQKSNTVVDDAAKYSGKTEEDLRKSLTDE